MFLEDIRLFKVFSGGRNLAGAVADAGVVNGAVCIPPDYTGVDVTANPGGVRIWDLRSAAQNAAWQDGSPGIIARVNLAGVAANVAATNFLTVKPPSGVYRVSIYLVNTAAFTTAGILATIGWTDDKQAQTLATTATAVGAGSDVLAQFIVQSSGAAQITYALSSTGTYGAASAFLVLERLT